VFRKLVICLALIWGAIFCGNAQADSETNEILHRINSQLFYIQNVAEGDTIRLDSLIILINELIVSADKIDSLIVCQLDLANEIDSLHRAVKPSNQVAVYDYNTLDADSAFVIAPGFSSKMIIFDLVKYTTNDGPCSLYVKPVAGGDAFSMQIPATGFNMGAQGSFVPSPIYLPVAADTIFGETLGALSNLKVIWIGDYVTP